MAVVLSSEKSSYFASSSLQLSPSQTKFVESSTYKSKLSTTYRPSSKSSSESVLSSAPLSPRAVHDEFTDVSCAATPGSNLSITSDFAETLLMDEVPKNNFSLPSYSDEKLYIQPQLHYDVSLKPPPSRLADLDSTSPAGQDSSERPETPELVGHAEDDIAVTSRPSRQVDYLSHDWRGEDIWTSWRYIVNRRAEYTNSARLENASWRMWMKAKNNLKTITPESLNWYVLFFSGIKKLILTINRFKDCDVTWLYGPLRPKSGHLYSTQTEPSNSGPSKTDSLVDLQKRPILKKRSMSETILQRSILPASRLRQATAAVRAQETWGIPQSKATQTVDDYVALPLPSRHTSIASRSTVQSTDSSAMTSPYTERKRIHFNEQVEQFTAVEIKGEDDNEMDRTITKFDDQSASDDSDDCIVMKRVKAKRRNPGKSSMKRFVSGDGETIAILPSAKLKYQEDTPEPPETAVKHSQSPTLSPSSSRETRRPTKRSKRFYCSEEEDDNIDEISVTGSGWRSTPVESGMPRSASFNSLYEVPAGMRDTPSRMFMPCEDADATAGDGIIRRVIDTVNTARDIAYAILHPCWRK